MSWKFADQGVGGDPYPGESDEALVERQHVNDSYGQDSQFDDRPIVEYKFFFANGELDVSGAHDLDQLRERNNVPHEHSGPMAVGNLIVQDGTAIWEVTTNVGIGALTKALKKYTKDAGWDWGGVTTMKGEPLGNEEKLARKSYWVTLEGGQVQLWTKEPDRPAPSNTGRLDVVGRVATYRPFVNEQLPVGTGELNAFIKEALDEFVADHNLRLAEYPGGGNAVDYIKNNAPMGEDLELKNIYSPNPNDRSTERLHKDRDRSPEGIFKCPDCARLFHRWHEYITHRRTEQPQVEEVQDGHFPTVEESESEMPSFTEARVANVVVHKDLSFGENYRTREEGDPLASLAMIYDAENDTLNIGAHDDIHHGDMWPHITADEAYSGWVSVSDKAHQWYQDDMPEKTKQRATGLLHQHLGRPTKDMDEDPNSWDHLTASKFESNFLHDASRLAIKQPKDMFSDPVPFIYDIELDKIFVGHPGARHGEIEAPAGTKFTPGGIVEGEYQPGGKVQIESQSDTPYSIKHMLGLWYYQHPEFEVTGIMMAMPDGKTRKIATAKNIGAYVIGQAAQDPAVHAAWLALQKAGGTVYGVGGVVRDALLGKPSKDVDLLVTGLPSEAVHKALQALPGRVDLTGKDFGVFRYNVSGNEVEVALPRTEKSTGDRRVDFDVAVDHNLPIEKDLERRDFTANAIAVNLATGEMVDPYNGQEDIANGHLKTVHPNSFPEDPTRLVRGLVAHSRHGLEPDPQTRREMQAHAPALKGESAERIQAELDKLFSSDNPGKAVRLAHSTGMLKYLLPEVDAAWDFDQNNPHHAHKLGEHLINVLDHTASKTKDPDLRLAALLHDIGKPASEWLDPDTGGSHFYKGPDGQGANHEEVGAELAEARLRELRYPGARTTRVRDLITYHMYPDFSSPKGARKFLNKVGEHADDLMTLREADRSGKGTDEYQDTKTPVQVQRDLVNQVREAKEPTDRAGLAINGNDLMGLGLQPGPAFAQILQALTDLVLENPEYNDKHTLLNHIRHELMPSDG